MRELAAPRYGTKAQLWSRLQTVELECVQRKREQSRLNTHHRELQAASVPIMPIPVRGPWEPTPMEIEQHSLTHLPAATCCEFCRLGRAVDDHGRCVASQEAQERKSVISLDLAFLKTSGANGLEHAEFGTTLVVVDADSVSLKFVPIPSHRRWWCPTPSPPS